VEEWAVKPRGAAALASELSANRDDAYLYKDLATLRTEPPVIQSVEELRWKGPTPEFASVVNHLEQPRLLERAQRLSAGLDG